MKTNLFGIILKEVIARSIILVVSLLFYAGIYWSISGRMPLSPWLFAGLALLFVNSFMQSYWLSALSARFRDLPPIVASIMRMMFFVTPIFWYAECSQEWISCVFPARQSILPYDGNGARAAFERRGGHGDCAVRRALDSWQFLGLRRRRARFAPQDHLCLSLRRTATSTAMSAN